MPISDGGWMRTHSGRKLIPSAVDETMFCIDDIAIGLSGEHRFGNQTAQRLSVAQHSVLVSELVPQEDDYPLRALLHDASEAYLKDIPSAVKRLLTSYKALEADFMEKIERRFGIGPTDDPVIKMADTKAALIEARRLMNVQPSDWGYSNDILNDADPNKLGRILPDTEARFAFLSRFDELVGDRMDLWD